ncbi:MAG: helicase-related protein, partial [Desulfobacterales bacterium]
IQSVLSLRTAQMRIDEIKTSEDGFIIDDFNTRCRFALRFGDIRDDNNQAIVRADSVREAFNSPFRPFILASTSIGQEGLDFHTWCHAVVHWNLPSNPVDLEQREGRVHRYKGHAIRKNIAEKYGLAALSEAHQGGDPWQTLFQIASQNKSKGHSDLIPYWIFEEGSARVERRIPLLPYSKEVGKLKRLKQSLALYRMVFGQPRQEDLLFSLSQNGNYESVNLDDWMISLQPPAIDL